MHTHTHVQAWMGTHGQHSTEQGDDRQQNGNMTHSDLGV